MSDQSRATLKSDFFCVNSKVKDFAVLFASMSNVSIRSMLQCFPKSTCRELTQDDLDEFVQLTGGEKEVGRHYLRSCHLCRGDLTFVEDLFQ